MLRALQNQRRKVADGDGGFTLIELLIVIVILGVLAAIVVFSVQGITDRGKTAACDTTKSTISTAYEAYIANSPTGDKPAAWTDLYPKFVHNATAPSGVTIDWATGQVTGTC